MQGLYVACVAGPRRGKGMGMREKQGGGGGGGVAPAASLLVSPLRPVINMQMRDICKMPDCQITPKENPADFLASLSGMSKTKPHGGFDRCCKAKNALRSI